MYVCIYMILLLPLLLNHYLIFISSMYFSNHDLDYYHYHDNPYHMIGSIKRHIVIFISLLP